MNKSEDLKSLKLSYTLLCEDVRVEASGHLSLMGVLHQLVVPQFPVTVIRMGVLNHWEGDGEYLTEVRILTPDRRQTVAVSQPSGLSVPAGGYADNVTVFVNTVFYQPGSYVVQMLVNSTLFAERLLPVILPEAQAGTAGQSPMTHSEQVN